MTEAQKRELWEAREADYETFSHVFDDIFGDQDTFKEKKVRSFHVKFGFPVNIRLKGRKDCTKFLHQFANGIEISAKSILPSALRLQELGDERAYRVHLLIEELGEVVRALADRDIVQLADALGDLDYVTNGTAITYDVPLARVFLEIHRSNMSKTRDSGDSRMKAKDPDRGYEPPRIKDVLNAHRTR